MSLPVDANTKQCNKHQSEDCQGAVGDGFCDVDGLRVEGHDDFVLACRNLDGTQHIVGAGDVSRLSVDGTRPAGIVDFAQDDDPTLLALDLIRKAVGS